MDLKEWWGEDGPMPEVNEVPLEDLVRQHRVRYIVHTAEGDIVLRFIGALKMRSVELNLMAADPEYNTKRRQLLEMTSMLKQCPGAPDLRAEQLRLASQLEGTFYEYFAACFVRPKATAEQVQALASALLPEEWRMLRVLLIQLIAARPSGTVASAMLTLCAKYGVTIADDLTLENMTAQQLAVLDQAAGDEGKAIMEAVKR